MGETSPLAVLVAIIVGMTVVGLIAFWVRARSTFSGYEDIAPAAREIERVLAGELFRDGRDLVISGNHRQLPVIVRFSYDENTPGLNVQMKAPASFSMSVVPKGERSTEGRVAIRTDDEMFDARFTTRSDQPTQSKMFMGKRSLQQLQKLLCSSKTFFTVTKGAIEISELVVPRDTGHHVIEHIKQMGELAAVLRSMPDAETIKIETIKREGQTRGRLVLAGGIVLAVVVVGWAMSNRNQLSELVGIQRPREPVPADDSALIPHANQYRLTDETDIPPDAMTWLRDHGQEFKPRMTGNYCGGAGGDVAYMLEGLNSQRVVLLCDGNNVFDSLYASVAVVTHLPRTAFSRMHWARSDQPAPDGDGVLIIQRLSHGAAAVVVYRAGGATQASPLADLEGISLQ